MKTQAPQIGAALQYIRAVRHAHCQQVAVSTLVNLFMCSPRE